MLTVAPCLTASKHLCSRAGEIRVGDLPHLEATSFRSSFLSCSVSSSFLSLAKKVSIATAAACILKAILFL